MNQLITREQLDFLCMFKADTHSISLSPTKAQPMIDAGLIEWVPPVFGGSNYTITEKGRGIVRFAMAKGDA